MIRASATATSACGWPLVPIAPPRQPTCFASTVQWRCAMSDSKNKRAGSERTRAGLLLLVVPLLGACSWFTDFKEQPKIDPWESVSDTVPFRGNPQFSVPVYGSVAPGYAYSRM